MQRQTFTFLPPSSGGKRSRRSNREVISDIPSKYSFIHLLCWRDLVLPAQVHPEPLADVPVHLHQRGRGRVPHRARRVAQQRDDRRKELGHDQALRAVTARKEEKSEIKTNLTLLNFYTISDYFTIQCKLGIPVIHNDITKVGI